MLDQIEIDSPGISQLNDRLRVRQCGSRNVDIVTLVKNYLLENMEKDPSVKELADYFFISARTLSRRLNDAGTNYRDISKSIKKHTAISLLLNGDLPVSVISSRVGFADSSNFTKAFKSWTGHTPKSYRRDRSIRFSGKPVCQSS